MQDALLPTAAYVGGPGELGYLAQVAPLYPFFDLAPPLVIPRARFRLIPPAVHRLLAQLDVRSRACAEERPDLLSQLAPPVAGGPDASWLRELEVRFDEYAPPEKHLQRDAERARASVRHALARLERRHRLSGSERDRTLRERVEKLQAWLCPGGLPQERVHGVAWFAAHVGPRALIEKICAAVDRCSTRSVKDILL